MEQYKRIVRQVFQFGDTKGDRTGTGAISVFNVNETFDLQQGFPLVTGKFTPFGLVASELLWFLSGSTNNEDLRRINGNNSPTIWEEWANIEGDLGPVYGKQWRDWGGKPSGELGNDGLVWQNGVDQIQKVIDILITDPNSRRMVITAWNPNELDEMALEPCHYAMEFYTQEASQEARIKNLGLDITNELKSMSQEEINTRLDELGVPKLMLSCKYIQRSCDVFLGVPFNIASYALLTHLIAHCTGMLVNKLHFSGGNTHIYNNHTKQAVEYLHRDTHPLPSFRLTHDCPKEINKITKEHFFLEGYKHNGHISAEVSI